MPRSQQKANKKVIFVGAYFSPDIPLTVKQQMQEGLFPIDIQCDLRGADSVASEQILANFIYDQLKKNKLNCLLLIDDEAIQKNTQLVAGLAKNPNVLGIHLASPKDGGVGALYLYLKRLTGDLARPDDGSFLVDETRSMENQRRLQEQEGMRRFGRVNQRDRVDETASAGNELGHHGPKEHPFLQSQRFDGIDPSVSPAPDIGTDARREFDNELRNQEQEKQLRLGNMPKPTAPEPKR
jgi:hypothetical protein